MVKKLLALSILAITLFSGCTQKSTPASGSAAADFTLQDLTGKNVKLSDMKGKVVVLEFWATWCPPCRASIPGMEKIHNKYKDKGVVVLAVSVDEGGWDEVKSFVKQYGITYTVLKGDDDVSAKYQIRSIPMLLVLDKEGKISKRYLGLGSDEELEKDIKAIL